MRYQSTIKIMMIIGIMANLSWAFAYPNVYPFKPFELNEIESSVQNITEDVNFIKNITAIENAGLSQGRTLEQPWTSTFWPLLRGLIADPYNNAYNPFAFSRDLSWRQNLRIHHRRQRRILDDWRDLRQAQLDKMAPSEKYDLLLGDETFDLTNKMWEYMEKWGGSKENSFISSLDIHTGLIEHFTKSLVDSGRYTSREAAMRAATQMATRESENYVLKDKNSMMATWEGICHGWATASGIVPRPLHYVDFPLPNGKRLRFYPDDIKGLVSLLWANSLVQDARWINEQTGEASGGGVIMAGLRCNDPSPSRDQWGRLYDSRADRFSGKLEPRCVGVHPAIWHLGVVNLIGKQKRSFIVERKISEAIDNHPMQGYRTEYFNPYTGSYTSLAGAIKPLTNEDQFFAYRSPLTKKIVGVKLKITYIDWERPDRDETDSPSKDKTEKKDMLYDLELDEHNNIVGGQWRSTEVGGTGRVRADHDQPDFFWAIAKDWRRYFQENTRISRWTNHRSLPPRDWKEAAHAAHAFIYEQTRAMGFNDQCDIVNVNTGEELKAPCEHKIMKPQPLINVVNKLVELSRGPIHAVTIESRDRSDDGPTPGQERRERRRERRRN